MAVRINFKVEGDDVLVSAAADVIANRAGAEDRLMGRISQVVRDRGFSLEEERGPMSKDVKILIGYVGTTALTVLWAIAYAFGFNSGQKDILARLPSDQKDEIEKILDDERAQRFDDMDCNWD